MNDPTRIQLSEDELPRAFLNLSYYLNKYLGILPPPPLHPGTKEPLGPQDLAPLFPMELIKQEVSLEEFIEIPEPVREIYKTYRATPLVRAKSLEKQLDTPARIYFKYEGASPSGSHKYNTALVQAYFNGLEGTKRIATETGAGQWGSALSIACQMLGIDCEVYMVRLSADQKPYRRFLMEMMDAKMFKSPSTNTQAGRAILAQNPDHPGSLGIAISEAVEIAATHDDTKYSLGSVLNHVCLHQSIIGLETKLQLAKVGDYPDVVIGCHGGGSNFAGITFPFVADQLKDKKLKTRFIAAEPMSCPTLTQGEYRYDFGDTAGMTPLMMMYTLGHDFTPPAIHAGGLRYHGAAPLVSLLKHQNIIEAVAYDQEQTFAAGVQFAKAEGIIPAPESCHAIRAAIDEALRAKEEGQSKTIVFNLSGHGHFDMQSYGDYLAGKMNTQK